jgi:pimeloyl-ACP methyl ester carboxylesterase
MKSPTRETFILSSGGKLSYLTAGDRTDAAILLIHGFPSSSQTFRDVIPVLSEVGFVVAPDMPGFGQSDVLERPSFDAVAQALEELLVALGIGDRFVYLHDFGTPRSEDRHGQT